MAPSLKDLLLNFIADLRGAGVRISVAESLDAMNAVATAGLMRVRMREALRAALIKDEADSAIFDAAFARYFSSARDVTIRRSQGARIGMAGGGGRNQSPPLQPPDQPTVSQESAAGSTHADRKTSAVASAQRHGDKPGAAEEGAQRDGSNAERGEDDAQRTNADVASAGDTTGANHLREIERLPFARYSDFEYEQARDTLAILKRRLRMRLGRRLHRARKGRLDFRRTLRAAIQRGGALRDLRFRARHPRHIDLLILADVSGSVKYASTLMLELVAGAGECFRHVRSFVYIDRMAEAEFSRGHMTMTPPLDLYARSDFGRVLIEVWEMRAAILTRETVVLIIGDARNNRRAPRADLLREIARRCRHTIWLNPEPVERWNSGDSVIDRYAREVDELIPCGCLHTLERALELLT
jgi:uncharacterized protein with von Willebrand factor type A (vWA) domain